MAYTTINKSSDYFNTKLWSGNGSSQTLTGVGHQTDMVWIKSRTDTRKHNLYDIVRGVQKRIVPNDTVAEDTATGVTAFGTDGFTVGSETDTNGSSRNFVGWSWNANGAGSANTDGSISSTVSANTTSGFSIVSWDGSDANGNIGHGLGLAPRVIFIKNRESAESWYVYHESMGNGNKLTLNDTSAQSSAADWWQDTSPTNSVFYVSGVDGINGPHQMIAYCFAEKTGYSKFGSYTGNGNADGTFVYTGFKPAMIIFKQTNTAGGQWYIYDNKRGQNELSEHLYPNLTNAESTGDNAIDILSNGFKMRSSNGDSNASGSSYIYMAFAEAPLVGTNNVPANAR